MTRRIVLVIFALTSCAWSQSFEVASIRPRADDRGVGLRIDASRLMANNNSLSNLIGFAYDLKPYQVLGLPGWAETERYDVTAKAEGDAELTRALARPMMQALLADRFQLKVHRETREMPVYALVVAKGGSKLKESGPDQHAMLTCCGGSNALVVLKVTAGNMAQLVNQLSNNQGVERPVLDRTGLTGVYDYTLKSSPASGAGADLENTSIFTAIEDQLGLKLEPAKASVEVLIVDRAEHPSEN